MATSPPLSLRFSLCATLPPPAGLHCLYSDGLALSVYPPRNPLHALGELAATVLRSFTVRSLSAASPLSGAIALPRLSLPHASPTLFTPTPDLLYGSSAIPPRYKYRRVTTIPFCDPAATDFAWTSPYLRGHHPYLRDSTLTPRHHHDLPHDNITILHCIFAPSVSISSSPRTVFAHRGLPPAHTLFLRLPSLLSSTAVSRKLQLSVPRIFSALRLVSPQIAPPLQLPLPQTAFVVNRQAGLSDQGISATSCTCRIWFSVPRFSFHLLVPSATINLKLRPFRPQSTPANVTIDPKPLRILQPLCQRLDRVRQSSIPWTLLKKPLNMDIYLRSVTVRRKHTTSLPIPVSVTALP
ncbi:hypothetical protein C8F04DRAFT_1196882 [Mycena alexandri]|uniref:Uncharacterized protein n=1 Tax=Mycena alexandri TaxID=1745969 RepID=A0AAD6S4N4_9AGAR|nr:hypothetical protein C8F04DRAFT_1196882 [Mycena alexandri]